MFRYKWYTDAILKLKCLFILQGFEAMHQTISCTIRRLQMMFVRDICSDLADAIADAFDECYSDTYIRETVSDCINLQALIHSIFSTEILTLEYSRLFSIQVSWTVQHL